jgi:N-acetylmuramoyl-L-alanine amidase
MKPKSLPLLSFLSLVLLLMLFAVPVLAGDEGMVNGSIVNIRKGPGVSYSTVTKATDGQVLSILEKKQDWYKVRLQTGLEGWIRNDLVDVILKKVTVTESVVNLRSGPGTSYKLIKAVKYGQILNVLAENNGWYKVKISGVEEAWVAGWLVAVHKDTGSVSTGNASNTSNPNNSSSNTSNSNTSNTNTSNTNTSTSGSNTAATNTSASGSNTAASSGSSSAVFGYVIIKSDVLNVRQGPGTGYATVTQIGLNEQHTAIESQNGWYKIIVNSSINGWVSGKYVKFVAGTVPQGSTGTQGQTSGTQGQTSGSQGQNTGTQGQTSGTQGQTSPVKVPSTVMVTGNTVNIRQSGNSAATVVDQVKSGDVLTVLSSQNDWYQVRLPNGKTGWIINWYVKAYDSTNPSRGGTVQTDVLIVPIAEGKNFKVLDVGGKPQLVFEGFTQSQVKVIPNSNEKILILEIQGPSTRNYEGKIERLGISKVNVYPKSDKSMVELTFNFMPLCQTSFDAVTKAVTIQFTAAQNKGLAGKVIVLDPGHASVQPGGGLDPGAIGTTFGLQEKDVNLAVVLKVKTLLEDAGAKVVLTHSGRTDLTLAGRAAVANNIPADIFVAIHANLSLTPGIGGHSTYFYAPSGNAVLYAQRSQRQKLATLVQREMVAAGGRRNIGVLEANFAVLRDTTVPSILVETAFLSDKTEEALLATDSYRQKLATGIFNGIKAYFN